MSADIVNLRLARKAKRRVEAADAGAANRAKFGRTRTEREIVTLDRGRAARHLDGHKIDRPPTDEPIGEGG